MKIFISGSKSISKLPDLAKTFIDQFIENNDEILIGDCYGVDAVVQKHLESKGFSNITVYCSGVNPRNNFTSSAKIHSCAEAAKGLTGRAFHYVKDVQMAKDCDQALMIWDGKSKGSAENLKRIKEMGKPFVVIRG
jgi:adenine-specific DNA-methyltransferase